MRNYFLFFLLSRLLGNPLLALIALGFIYLVADRRFIGLLPDVTRPLRRSAHMRQLRSLLELNPSDAGARLELGTLLLEAGRISEALSHLEQAAVKLTDHAHAQFSLGAAYVEAGRFAEGEAALRRAVELRPEVQYGLPYVYLAAAVLNQAKDTSEPSAAGELTHWLQAVARYGNVETACRMGAILQRAGRRQDAVAMYQEALAGYRHSPPFARRAARRWALCARWNLWLIEMGSHSRLNKSR